ncbi:putative Anticodon-binding domain, protein Lsm12 [Helianthus annuus]|nr:putative Anticodon-binding domain, protein Lsm12 [Helianthus annuus]
MIDRRVPYLMTFLFKYMYFIYFLFILLRLPVRWDKIVIVVMNEVRVSSPYLAESVTRGTPAINERVRKVVKNKF